MNKKIYWKTYLTIRIGEFEFVVDKIIEAPTYEKAFKTLRAEARNYYADEPEDTDEGYSFFGGEVVVTCSWLNQITKQEWCKEQFRKCLIDCSLIEESGEENGHG